MGDVSDVRRRSVRGGLVTIASQFWKLFAQLGCTAILARLLTPGDFGLYGISLVVVGFLGIFKDAGLSAATVQQNYVTREQVSNLFWVNVLLSLMLVAVVALLSPVVAWICSDPRLIPMQLVMAVGFVFGGLTIQHQSLLQRQIKLGELAAINTVALSSGVVMAIFLAWMGARYWALVGQFLSVAAVALLASWIATGWIPSRPSRRSGVRPMLKFGGYLLGGRAVNYFTRNFDNLLIGVVLGTDSLGIYSKAYGLLMLPSQQINRPIDSVVLPGLCRLQDDAAAYRTYFLRALEVLTFIGVPVTLFSIAASDRIIAVMLGPQWVEAVPVFRALGPAALAGTLNVAPVWLATSLGRPRQVLHWALLSAPLAAVGYAVGLHWGIFGVAVSFTMTWTLMLVFFLAYTVRDTPLSLRDIGLVFWRPLIAALLAAGAVVYTRSVASSSISDLTGLLADSIVYGVAYFTGLFLLPGGRRQVTNLLSSIRKQLSRGKPAPVV